MLGKRKKEIKALQEEVSELRSRVIQLENNIRIYPYENGRWHSLCRPIERILVGDAIKLLMKRFNLEFKYHKSKAEHFSIERKEI